MPLLAPRSATSAFVTLAVPSVQRFDQKASKVVVYHPAGVRDRERVEVCFGY